MRVWSLGIMENKVIPNREVPSLVENTWNVSEFCYNSSSYRIQNEEKLNLNYNKPKAEEIQMKS